MKSNIIMALERTNSGTDFQNSGEEGVLKPKLYVNIHMCLKI